MESRANAVITFYTYHVAWLEGNECVRFLVLIGLFGGGRLIYHLAGVFVTGWLMRSRASHFGFFMWWMGDVVGMESVLLNLSLATLPIFTRAPICLSSDGPVRREMRSTLSQVAMRRGISVARTRSGFDSPNITHLNVPRF